MKNNLQQKVALSLLAGAMLFGTGYIANTSIAYAASASKDINIQPNISADDNLDGLTVSKQAENNEKAENNTIIISGGKAYDVYAAITGGGDAVGNTAQMSGGTVAYLGGAATDYGDGDDGSVISNKVIMSDGKAQEVVGGEAFGTGTVETNCVTMTGGEAQNVYGGATYNSNATGNYVEISGKAIVTGSGDNGYEEDGVKTTNKGVYGAISGDPKGDNEGIFGSLKNNNVKISGEAQVSNAYGAYSFGGADVIGNSVEIRESAVIGSDKQGEGQVYGAYTAAGNAQNNKVLIAGGTVNDAFGAQTETGIATENLLEITSGTVHDAYAAVTGGGDAVGNIAQMSGGTVAYLGGAATDYGDGDDGSVISNKVIMSDGKAQEVVGGEAFGTGTVETNCVTMTGGEAQNVYGGATYNSNATGNYVEISGKAIVTGSGDNGYEEDGVKTTNKGVYGAISGDPKGDNEVTFGSLENNSVKISGAAHISNAYGAYSFGGADVIGNSVELMGNATVSGDVYGGYSKTGSVTGNTVKIGGNATVRGNVYGGSSATGSVTDNTIELSGNANVDNANLFGYDKKTSTVSFSRTLSQKAASSGNTLTIKGWSGSVNKVKNFEKIKFGEIDLDNLPSNGTVLTITNLDNNDLENTFIDAQGVKFKSGTEIKAGMALNFIASGNDQELYINDDNIEFGNFTAGVAQEGEGKLELQDGKLIYTSTEVHASGQTHLVAKNRVVAAAFVNQGSELIADALDTLSRTDGYGVKTFAAVYGNHSKYDVNSDLKINGWSSIVGVGSEKQLAQGDFSWGVFYENGSGNYRTANSFNNEFFRGDGSLVYNGGGIAARYAKKSGSYTEASLRAGMLKSEMDNALKDITGAGYGYKSETAYYGAHLGIGKILTLNESTSVDVYGKFFHTYNKGDNFDVAGDKFEFDSITSDLLRLGTRYTVNKNNKWSSYYGIAWEYEFNGDADMKAMNKAVPTQSMQGSSYMAEIGLNYQPNTASPWSFDLSMRGYAGEREGFSGNVQAIYNF